MAVILHKKLNWAKIVLNYLKAFVVAFRRGEVMPIPFIRVVNVMLRKLQAIEELISEQKLKKVSLNYVLKFSHLKSYNEVVQKKKPAGLSIFKPLTVKEAANIPTVPKEDLKPQKGQSSKKRKVQYEISRLPIESFLVPIQEEQAAQEEHQVKKKKRHGKKPAERDVSTFIPAPIPAKIPSPIPFPAKSLSPSPERTPTASPPVVQAEAAIDAFADMPSLEEAVQGAPTVEVLTLPVVEKRSTQKATIIHVVAEELEDVGDVPSLVRKSKRKHAEGTSSSTTVPVPVSEPAPSKVPPPALAPTQVSTPPPPTKKRKLKKKHATTPVLVSPKP